MSVYSAKREKSLHDRLVLIFSDCCSLFSRMCQIDQILREKNLLPDEELSLRAERELVEMQYTEARASFRVTYNDYYWDYPFLAILLHDELNVPDSLAPLIGGVSD